MLIPQTWPWTRKGQLENFEPFCCLHLGTRLYLSEMTVQIFPQLQVIDCWQTLGGVWSSPSWTTTSIHDSLVNSLFSEKNHPDRWLVDLPTSSNIWTFLIFPMIFPCFFKPFLSPSLGFPHLGVRDIPWSRAACLRAWSWASAKMKPQGPQGAQQGSRPCRSIPWSWAW